MKTAVISDIHDNLVNLEKCLNWCRSNEIEELICVGDVTNSETLKFLADNFPGTIYLIRGNMEIYKESEIENYSNISYLGRFGITKIGNKTVGICHEPKFIEEVVKKKPRPDIIFYGHTHKPWLEKAGGIPAANPGTLGGVFQKATFAVWDSGSGGLELKLLENLKVS